MPKDRIKPLTFQLPDGQNVSLITWAYVYDKLSEGLTPINQAISVVNEKLLKIDNELNRLTSEEE